jgi:aspartate kinase
LLDSSRNSDTSKRVIVKFGGASIADPERITRAVSSIVKAVKSGKEVIVVVSAMGKTTDELLSILHGTNKSIEREDEDDILSMGERISARIFTAFLKAEGLKSKYFDPSDKAWPIITDDNYSNANPILDECEKKVKDFVEPLLSKNIVPVIAGFIGKTKSGKISTIGRGGSDTTAFILANALKSNEVIMVTDSNGIMTADPKLIVDAQRIPEINIDTLLSLADSGKKFIHRKALKYKSPESNVKVINHMNGDLSAKGTIITGGIRSNLNVELENSSIASVTIIGNRISEKPDLIYGLIRKIKRNQDLAGLSLNYDSMIIYVIENQNLNSALKAIHNDVKSSKDLISMTIRKKLGFIKIKGSGLEETPGIIGKISESLMVNDINIFGILTITSSILVFVDWKSAKKTKKLIKKAVREDK